MNNPKINTVYFPEWEEDTIETHAPSEWERRGIGEHIDTRDIVKEDNERFARLCRKYGFKMSKENRKKR